MHAIKVADVAVKCSVTPQTIYRWVQELDFPKPFKIGFTTVWDEAEVNEWLNKQKEKRDGSQGKEGDQRPDVRPVDCPA